MDTKLKNNKVIPKILFMIMVISLGVALLPFNISNRVIYDKFGGEFYKSQIFNDYISEQIDTIYEAVDEEYNDNNEEKTILGADKNIKFIAINNKINKIHTNTEYKIISDFKNKEKGYVEIEGKNYGYDIKINNKDYSYEEEIKNKAKVEENTHTDEVKDISVYAVLPEVPKEDGQLRDDYIMHTSINKMKKNILVSATVGIVIFLITLIITKVKGYRYINEGNKIDKIYKVYSDFAVEFKVLLISILIIIDNGIALYRFYTNEGSMKVIMPKGNLMASISLKAIYIIMIFILIQNIKDKSIFKNSIIGKFNRFIKSKNKIIIFITIIVINIVIYSILNIFFRFAYKIKILAMSILILISVTVFIVCIISDLSNLLLLVKSVKMAVKKVGLSKRIILIFILIVVVNLSIFGIMLFLDGWIEHAFMVVVGTGAISFVLFTAYILVSLTYLNEIMEGVKKIESGDINYKIEVKGNDSFTVLAENINGIGNGLDNAIEERMKSEKMKSELITNVSHDLKTPLTSILNYVDLLKKEEVKPEYLNDYIAILDQKSKRLKVLIEDLFEAAKAVSGSVELNIEKIQLNQLLTQSIAEMENKILESNLDMKVNFPENKVYINADGKKLFRVFENLISNIVKYSLNGTRVYIDLYVKDEYAYVTFKNISAYELNFDEDEIIERFKRGDVSRSEEGSGLGLSIAKGLVELQGGEFRIQTDGDLFKAIVKLELS